MTKGSSWVGKSLIVAMLLGSAAPAAAEDEEKTGLAAALGLQAASGKSTIAEGGGGVEAALLSTDAMREAGRIIAALTAHHAKGRNVLIVSRAEQVNLMAADAVRRQITTITEALDAVKKKGEDGCKGAAVRPGTSGRTLEELLGQTQYSARLGLPDLAAIAATETTYSPIPLTLDDRMLVAAVGMSGMRRELASTGEWTSPQWEKPVSAASPAPPAPAAAAGEVGFIIPSELVATGAGNDVIESYLGMMKLARDLRNCPSQEAKDAVAAAKAYSDEITKKDEKAELSALAAAAQVAALAPQGRQPLILRVAAEQAGGTAITRANIWFNLGLPGAATVTSGLLASYRLMEPTTGRAVSTGFVRCATAPVSMKNVHLVVDRDAADYFTKDHRRGQTYCSYIATPG